jgi:thiol:disulfide interchange protein DsbG
MNLEALLAAASLAEELPEPINTVDARGSTIIGRFDAPCGLQGYAVRYTGLNTTRRA